MIQPFPPSIRSESIETDGATIHTRIGGTGPAVVMLHGFADTGDMWAPLVQALPGRTAVVPDLRGMGLSSHPAGGYDKKSQGRDIAQVLDRLGIDTAELVTHDIGNMVGYALAAQYPARVKHWVIMDAPLPGIGPWTADMISLFYFREPDIWPLGDLAVRKTFERFVAEQSRFDLTGAAELFAPHRSLLALYLWRITDAMPTR